MHALHMNCEDQSLMRVFVHFVLMFDNGLDWIGQYKNQTWLFMQVLKLLLKIKPEGRVCKQPSRDLANVNAIKTIIQLK